MLRSGLVSLVSLVMAGFVVLGAAGCGGGDTSGTGGSTSTGGAGGATASGGAGGTGGTTSAGGAGGAWVITLTSPSITEGGMFPADNTCAGLNVSPELDWTAAPPETKSFSLLLKDKSNNLIHSAIYDIPADLLMLPADVDKDQNPADVPGATQTKAYDNTTFGYLGPCPGGDLHTYEFTLYALDVATLPIVGVPAKESILDLSQEHTLVSATLTAQSDATSP